MLNSKITKESIAQTATMIMSPSWIKGLRICGIPNQMTGLGCERFKNI